MVTVTISVPAWISQPSRKTPAAGIQLSRTWHRAFEQIEHGPVPVIVVLHARSSAVAWNWRLPPHSVAECGAFYALPEGMHGIFVVGGGSVRPSQT